MGSAIVFHNGDATHAVESLPPRKFNDALTVTFCTEIETGDQEKGREVVRHISQLQLQKDLFLKQATSLRETNPVYKDGVTEINRELLTQWFDQEVPAPVLDCVVTVPVGQDGPERCDRKVQQVPRNNARHLMRIRSFLPWNLRCLISMIVETMHAVEW